MAPVSVRCLRLLANLFIRPKPNRASASPYCGFSRRLFPVLMSPAVNTKQATCSNYRLSLTCGRAVSRHRRGSVALLRSPKSRARSRLPFGELFWPSGFLISPHFPSVTADLAPFQTGCPFGRVFEAGAPPLRAVDRYDNPFRASLSGFWPPVGAPYLPVSSIAIQAVQPETGQGRGRGVYRRS